MRDIAGSCNTARSENYSGHGETTPREKPEKIFPLVMVRAFILIIVEVEELFEQLVAVPQHANH